MTLPAALWAPCPVCRGRVWEPLDGFDMEFRCTACEAACRYDPALTLMNLIPLELPLSGLDDSKAGFSTILTPGFWDDVTWARDNRAMCARIHKQEGTPA